MSLPYSDFLNSLIERSPYSPLIASCTFPPQHGTRFAINYIFMQLTVYYLSSHGTWAPRGREPYLRTRCCAQHGEGHTNTCQGHRSFCPRLALAASQNFWYQVVNCHLTLFPNFLFIHGIFRFFSP